MSWTEQYKKTAIPIQLAILTVCAVLHLGMGVPLIGILMFFVVMQFGAVMGAIWGARIRRKAGNDQLPRL